MKSMAIKYFELFDIPKKETYCLLLCLLQLQSTWHTLNYVL